MASPDISYDYRDLQLIRLFHGRPEAELCQTCGGYLTVDDDHGQCVPCIVSGTCCNACGCDLSPVYVADHGHYCPTCAAEMREAEEG